jgi:two-component system, OmpR family, response regulator
MRLLVVEDEPRLTFQLERVLTEAGYAVDCAYDGEKALFLGETENYDAVVLDLGLPRMDGVTVLKRWRAAGRTSSEITHGDVVLDTSSAKVTRAGQPVTLTGHEFRVLAYLMHNKGRVVSRTELTEHVYAQDFDRDSNTIEVFIGRLRRKLGPDLIETVRGLGYRIGESA